MGRCPNRLAKPSPSTGSNRSAGTRCTAPTSRPTHRARSGPTMARWYYTVAYAARSPVSIPTFPTTHSSRRICIDLYRELVRLRPEWRDDDDSRGALKVVMTGKASDPPDWQRHIGNKGASRGAGETVPRPRRPAPHGARARHVADRIRCPEPAHDVRGQADARPRADARPSRGSIGCSGTSRADWLPTTSVSLTS